MGSHSDTPVSLFTLDYQNAAVTTIYIEQSDGKEITLYADLEQVLNMVEKGAEFSPHKDGYLFQQ